MDAERRERIDKMIAEAVRLTEEANNELKRVLVEEVVKTFPTARTINLELEDDDGIQWYWIASVTDGEGNVLSPASPRGRGDVPEGSEQYEEVMEPLHELASDLFVTPDFCATWIALEVYAWIPEEEA